jgi:hypothetical protein
LLLVVDTSCDKRTKVSFFFLYERTNERPSPLKPFRVYMADIRYGGAGEESSSHQKRGMMASLGQ